VSHGLTTILPKSLAAAGLLSAAALLGPLLPAEANSDSQAAAEEQAGAEFTAPSRTQLRGLRSAWRAAEESHGLGAVEEVHAFYVTRGGGVSNRYAAGCVDRPGYEAVSGRVLRRVGSKGNRWRAVSDFNIYNVDADGEDNSADDVIPDAAYERLQNAIRYCGRQQGTPYFYPGAEDQSGEEE